MDPASLITSILSVMFNCTKAAIGAQNVLRSCQNAPQLLSALCTDCSVISLTLSKMQLLVQEDNNEYSTTRFQDPAVIETLRGALDTCNVTLTELETKATSVYNGEGDLTTTWSRLRFLGNESQLEELSNRLRYHQKSLSVLLQVFQSEGIFRLEDLVIAIQDTLSRHAIVLEQMAGLLRTRRRIPPSDLRNLARESAQMAESESSLISRAMLEVDQQLTTTEPYLRANHDTVGVNRDNADGVTLLRTLNSSASTWSNLMSGNAPTPIFRIYSDVLFDFITETWPSNNGRIGYYQLREFANFSALKQKLPPRNWIEGMELVLLNYAFSTEPLKDLFEAYGVEYEAKFIRRTQQVGIYSYWANKPIEERSYQDIAPILERHGWQQWLVALLRSHPTNWHLDHASILETLPQSYRRKLPKGQIPRELLPASADIAVPVRYPPDWPFSFSNVGRFNRQIEKWRYLKETYLYHNVFMYKKVD